MANQDKENFLNFLREKGKLPRERHEEPEELDFLSEMPEDDYFDGTDLDSLMQDLGDDLSFHDNPKENIRSNDLFVQALKRSKHY